MGRRRRWWRRRLSFLSGLVLRLIFRAFHLDVGHGCVQRVRRKGWTVRDAYASVSFSGPVLLGLPPNPRSGVIVASSVRTIRHRTYIAMRTNYHELLAFYISLHSVSQQETGPPWCLLRKEPSFPQKKVDIFRVKTLNRRAETVFIVQDAIISMPPTSVHVRRTFWQDRILRELCRPQSHSEP